MPYLIDGHNLIARLPDIDLEDPNDEAKLVDKLKGFVARDRKKCTVVFDGGLPGGVSTMSTGSVKVIFAASQHTNADNVIKERIRKIPDARNWTIVSSDNEVLDFARQHKMKAQTSAEFAQTLQRKPRIKDSRGEALHVQVPKDEVDEWLNIFGDV
jgi:predicted RNA-binding protein with PIN domain